MVKFSRILLPVDFSERCLGMTHYARALAEKYDAELILLHVINPVFITPEIGMAPPAVVAVPQWLVTEKNKLLEGFAVRELAGLRVRRLVYEGIPESQIVEIANAEDVQLVIMPTHGYGGFRRFLIGSVTAKVLDDLPIAVFTGAHMEQHVHDDKVEFPVIACAIDLNAGSSETLLAAAQWAQDFGAKLAVVHVAPPPRKQAELQPQLDELVKSELANGHFSFEPSRLVSCVKDGDMAQTVCDFAQQMDAKLLVIGRGHDESRLHAHAYSIVRQSPCPVISL